MSATRLRDAVRLLDQKHGVSEPDAIRLLAQAGASGDLTAEASMRVEGQHPSPLKVILLDEWWALLPREDPGEQQSNWSRLSWDIDQGWLAHPDADFDLVALRFPGFEDWLGKVPTLLKHLRMPLANLIQLALDAPEQGWTSFYANHRDRPECAGLKRADFEWAFNEAKGARPSGRPKAR